VISKSCGVYVVSALAGRASFCLCPPCLSPIHTQYDLHRTACGAAPLSASRWTTPQPASCSCTSLLHVFLHLTATLAPPLSYGTRKKSRHNLSANPPTKSSFLCNIPLCYCTLCFCKQTCVFLSPFSLSASD